MTRLTMKLIANADTRKIKHFLHESDMDEGINLIPPLDFVLVARLVAVKRDLEGS